MPADRDDAIHLWDLNPDLDRSECARAFAVRRRLQVRNFLTEQAALELHRIIDEATDWGMSWQAGHAAPEHIRPDDMASRTPEQRNEVGQRLMQAMQGLEYGFAYKAYPLVDAYKEKWSPGHPLETVIEHINAAPFLEFIKDVTGFEVVKADGQATLFGPGHFLSEHNDSHVAEGWRIAYVYNLTKIDWRPDWGGYLVFYDDDGNIIDGFRPRFNALNIFAVPQPHSVTYVPSFSPVGRYAITGWLRDR